MDKILFDDMKRRAENGDDSAMICLSRYYLDTSMKDDDLQFANRWRRKAEDKGNELAKIIKYYHGWDVEVDLIETSKLLQSYLANETNHKKEEIFVAYHMMSYLYGEGIGVEKDVDRAFDLCNKAAQNNCIAALNNLAISYQYGEGCEENIDKCIELYQRAHNMGHSAASFNLGLMYHYGRGVKIDKEKAIHYYGESATKGFLKSYTYLLPLLKEKKYVDKEREFLIRGALLKCEETTKNLIKFLTTNKSEWEPRIHDFYEQAIVQKTGSKDTNKQIINFLLISKNRNQSKNKLIKNVFVKGISMNVVKFFCELHL